MDIRLLFLIYIFVTIEVSGCYSQTKRELIKLSLDTLVHKEFPLRYFPNVKYIWKNSSDTTLADSILYNIGLFNVVVKKEYKKISYNIYRKYNPEISKEYFISYPDSVKKNKNEFYYLGCYELKDGKFDYYMIPSFGSLVHSDKRINEHPIEYVYQQAKHVVWKDTDIFVYRNPGSDVNVKLRNMKTGEYHRKMKINGMEYKFDYSLGDNLPIGKMYYRLDSIDNDWKFIYLSEQNVGKMVVPKDIMDKLSVYFKDNNYMLIDFWGTWCSPCIASFPKMKDLYKEVHSYCSLIGICYDNIKNLEKMNVILSEHNIVWKNIFDNNNMSENPESIVGKLNISSFPTYLLINKKGEILLMDSGYSGFDNLRSILDRTIHVK